MILENIKNAKNADSSRDPPKNNIYINNLLCDPNESKPNYGYGRGYLHDANMCPTRQRFSELKSHTILG